MEKEILQCVGYIWEDYDTEGNLLGKHFFEDRPEHIYLKELHKNIKPIYIRKGNDEKVNSS